MGYVSDAAGAFAGSIVSAGNYEISAGIYRDGLYYSARKEVMVNAGGTSEITLVLEPPAVAFRRVTLGGDIYVVDHENWPWSNERGTFRVDYVIDLDPSHRNDIKHFSECVGDEVVAELDVVAKLAPDNQTVTLDLVARLYEGTACDDAQLEDDATVTLTLPDLQQQPAIMGLINTELDGGDVALFSLYGINLRQ